MSFEIEGRLHKVFETEQKSGTFQTREFVLEISSGNYPQLIKFQATQDKCTILNTYKEGDAVKVYFDLRGREWNGKYLTNINAWRIENSNGGTASTTTQPIAATTSAPPSRSDADFPNFVDEPPMQFDDDLPF